MTTFVIVHGEFGGGWEWTPVARLLRGLGHEVFTPTLTGVGEHTHLASSHSVGLSTHVQDIVGLLEFEDLRGVVLCGVSYGGVPVTCAADRVAHRIGMVVYLDALVPRDGESALDLLPSAFGDLVLAGLGEHGESWQVPVPPGWLPPRGWGDDASRSAHLARLRGQPAMSLVEPAFVTSAVDHIPRAFVRCVRQEFDEPSGDDPIDDMANRARQGFWHYREIDATHDPHLSNPNATVRVLSELSASVLAHLPDAEDLVAQPLRKVEATREQWLWSPN